MQDYLNDLEPPPDTEETTAAVAHLIEKLSQASPQPIAQPSTSFTSAQTARTTETRPLQEDQSSPVSQQPNPQAPVHFPASSSTNPPDNPPDDVLTPNPRPLGGEPLKSPPRSIPLKSLLWGGLGLVGIGATLTLAIATFSRLHAPKPIGTGIAPPMLTGDEFNRPPTPRQDSAAVMAALQALNTNNLEQVRIALADLLDQGDLVGAESVIAVATPGQLMEPNIAFARGRLAWQQMVTGQSPSSVDDALRAWTEAVEAQDDLLEAWAPWVLPTMPSLTTTGLFGPGSGR
ncbi:MAG: hypothetical protein HC922_06865 [Leptolyngbyaceae cyanobacterium SM2_3_12]|nr:hypothetical protein [Leptolyngbyaceae cyanobacterium SM2_3_12]